MAEIRYAHIDKEEMDKVIEKSRPANSVAGENWDEVWPKVRANMEQNKREQVENLIGLEKLILVDNASVGESKTKRKKR